MKLRCAAAVIGLSLAAVVGTASSSFAGVIDDALNLPGMEEIKTAKNANQFGISFASLDDVTDANGKRWTVLAERDGRNLRLNSKVYGEGTNAGVIAQHIVHEYWHWKLDHQGNSKENELPVRKKEAEFWRAYKAAHPGTTDPDCDANEKMAYSNGAFRSDADIKKMTNTDYGYPDDPEGKEKSQNVYSVACAGSTCDLMQESGQTLLVLYGSQVITPEMNHAMIQMSAPDAEDVSRITFVNFEAHAPSIEVPGFGSTGPNFVTLDPERASFGYIDHNTNKVSVYLFARITNDLYDATNPIRVTSHGRGFFDPIAQRLTLDTLAFDDVPLARPAVPALSRTSLAMLLGFLAAAGTLMLWWMGRARREAA